MDAARLDALCAFCLRHPVHPMSEADLRWFITRVASGPQAVRELAASDGLALVVLLIDTCTNANDAAELIVLGHRPTDASERLFDEALRWAHAQVRSGPRSNLDIAGPEQTPVRAEQLARHGFREAYRLFTMERPTAAPPALPLPSQLRWADVDAHSVDALYDVLRRAFAEVPGAYVVEREEFRTRTLSRPIPVRVLFTGERLVGFARVELDEHRCGTVQTIGRDPDTRGHRLGPILLAEALRLLDVRGATRVQLEVAALNTRALRLYESFGFNSRRSLSMWRKPAGAA